MSIKQLTEKITHNWPIKLVCFALAIILYILHQASLVEKKTFIVPLTVIQEGNLTYTDTIDKTVTVVVKTSPEYINVIQESDIVASLNLNTQNENGIYPVNVSLSERVLTIDPLEIQVKPERINVNVVEKVLKYVEIKPSIVETVAKGYKIEKISCDPPYIEVIGPKSVVDSIEEVYTKRIPVSNATSSFTAETYYYELNKLLEVPYKGPYKVTVAVVPEEIVKEFNNLKLNVFNLDDNLKLDNVLPSINVTVEGTVPFFEKYTIPKNAVSINLANIHEAGEYEIPVRTHFANALTVSKINFDKVTVQISEDLSNEAELEVEPAGEEQFVEEEKSESKENVSTEASVTLE